MSEDQGIEFEVSGTPLQQLDQHERNLKEVLARKKRGELEINFNNAEVDKLLRNIRQTRNKIFRCGWGVASVTTDLVHPGKLIVGLFFPEPDVPDKKILPRILVNGISCPRHPDKDFTGEPNVMLLDVDPSPATALNPRDLHVEVEESLSSKPSLSVINPYCILPEWLSRAEIWWQNEGHQEEKVIILRPHPDDGLWNIPSDADIKVAIYIDLLADNKLLGRYKAYYWFKGNQLFAPIPDIRKVQCVRKTMEMRINHAKGVKVVLPPPVIMSIDHRSVIDSFLKWDGDKVED